MESNELLERNKIEEMGDIIYIAPHPQFPVKVLKDGGVIDFRWNHYAGDDTGVMNMLELFGRVCYKSEDAMTAESAEKFILKRVLDKHESVLEHISFTAKYVGSRAMSHQLVRHRIAAYSQESQRYCNYEKSGKLYCIVPPEIEHYSNRFTEFHSAISRSYDGYRNLIDQGVKPEDARHVLPNATKTEVVTTFNVRQWRHVFEHRGLNKFAQWEIRGVTLAILKEFARLYPVLFGDLLESTSE